MSRIRQDSKALKMLRLLPLAAVAAVVLWALCSGVDFSVEGILAYTPERAVYAAAFLILLYFIKSLSIFLPLLVLQAAGGTIFPPVTALLVNALGMAVCLSVPYAIGRFSGAAAVEKKLANKPKVRKILEGQRKHPWFACYFLRLLGFLPGDLVSMFLGTTGVPYAKYLPASLLGVAPGMAAATLMGASISDPASPLFWGSAAFAAAFSALSVFFYWQYQKKKTRPDF